MFTTPMRAVAAAASMLPALAAAAPLTLTQALDLAVQGSEATRAAAAEVRLQTALAYLDAYFASELLKLTTVSERHVQEELEVAKARLSSATGSSQEVLAATSARGMAEDESAEVRQQQSAARVTLQRWVGIRADDLAAPVELAAADEQAFAATHPVRLAAQRGIELARQEATVAASQRVQRYRSSVLVPAQQRTAAALAGYRSNQVALMSLFEARRMEVEAQRKLLSLQRELAKAWALLAYEPLLDEGAR